MGEKPDGIGKGCTTPQRMAGGIQVAREGIMREGLGMGGCPMTREDPRENPDAESPSQGGPGHVGRVLRGPGDARCHAKAS